MTTISKDADLTTLINVFAVDPSNQSRLVELLTTVTDHFVRHARVFISSSLHRSRDGTKVTMYAQWRSLDDYETMRRDPGPVPYLQEALTIATFEPGIYDVVESFVPPRVRLIRSRGHLRDLSIRRFGGVRRIHVLRIRGTKAGDLNQDGLVTRASEMIHLTGFRVHAAGG